MDLLDSMNRSPMGSSYLLSCLSRFSPRAWVVELPPMRLTTRPGHTPELQWLFRRDLASNAVPTVFQTDLLWDTRMISRINSLFSVKPVAA